MERQTTCLSRLITILKTFRDYGDVKVSIKTKEPFSMKIGQI